MLKLYPTSDLRWRIGDIQNAFDHDIGASAYRWMDRIYHDYQHKVSSSSKCPVDEASNILLAYINSMEKLSTEVLNVYGTGDDWRRTRQFIKRVRLLLECCYDMEMKIIDPDEDLEKCYTEGALSFQKPINQAWIEGKVPLPE
ncbi:hypothetical protein VNI00_004661 [Paramarasmius palmivorus]|uniref:Uncharacterized protein n=1 Tax=Paramarasmius palmivorus TaxID=297713 RepID=A0AAW0DHX5_9AGAR